MTDLPIVDTHLHIWDPRRIRYPWLDDTPKLNHPHLPDAYRTATAGWNIASMVFVQCEADPDLYREEVAWVTEQARAEPRIRGIVSWAPLEKGTAVRDELAALSANPLLRGIRRILQFEPDPEFCLQPDFVAGVQLLPEFGFTFDLCLKGDAQFRNALKLVGRCPDVAFIADHINKPFIREKVFEPWASYLRQLAGMPNAWCKLSGLINEAEWNGWTAQDLKPYIDHVLSCFGADRVLFGGDWPVCTLAGTYRQWLETLWEAVSGLSADEKRKLFHANAERFYRV